MVASPLQQFLRSGGTSSLSGSPLAGLGGPSAGARGIEHWLGMSGVELPPDQEQLQRAQTSYGNRQTEAVAYGQDPEGSAPDGLWSAAVGFLDAPGAAVRGAVSGLAGIDVEGHEVGEGGRLGAAMSRFARGLNPHDRTGVEEGGSQFGVGQWGALQTDGDDPLWQRTLLGAGALAGDIALDPLTYVTLGGAAVGKRAATEMVEASARSFAQRELGSETVEQFAKRSHPERATDFIRQNLGDDAAEQFAARNLARPSTVADDRAWRRTLGENTFAGEAAEAYLGGGSTGLRQWLRRELGDEAGERAFRELPRDVQGGLNIRVPLARTRDEQGFRTPITAGVGGGGRILEGLGLDEVAKGGTRARNRLRATNLGQSVSTKLSGTDGALYGKVVRDMVDGLGDDVGGHSYQMYAAVRRARKQVQAEAHDLQQASVETIAAMNRFVQQASDPDVATKVRDDMFLRPDELRSLRTATARDPETGAIIGTTEGADPQAVQTLTRMSDDERAGVAAAMAGVDYLEDAHRQLLAHGVDVGYIEAYVPIILADESRAVREAGRAVRASGRRGGGIASFDQTKPARQFWLPETAPDGTITSWRRLTPDEINMRQAGREAEGTAVRPGERYVEDPSEIIATYGDAVRKLSGRVQFQNALREHGVLLDGGTDTIRSVVASAVRDAEQAASGSAQAWREALAEVAGEAEGAAPGSRQAMTLEAPDLPDGYTSRIVSGQLIPQVQVRDADGNMVGSIQIVEGDGVLRLQHAHVDEAARGQGVGEAMYAEAADLARRRGVDLELGDVVNPRLRRKLDESGLTPTLAADGTPTYRIPAAALEQAAPQDPATRLRRAFDDMFAEATPEQRDTIWRRVVGDGEPSRVTVPDGPVERRVLEALRRAGWRPDGQEGGRPVYRAPMREADEAAEGLPADAIRQQIDQVLEDQQAFDRAVASLIDAPTEQQLENIDLLMDQLVDFQSRHVDGLKRLRPDGPADPDMGDVWSSKIKAAQERHRQTLEARRAAVTGEERLDEATRLLADQGEMRQIGARQGDAARLGRVARTSGADSDVNLPPELDVTLAPEWLAQTAEKFYKAAGPRSKELDRFVRGVYRPYLNFFKTTATVGRGYGYDARNVMGGLNNNWIAGVPVEAHTDMLKVLRARRSAFKQAERLELDRVVSETGLSRREAREIVDGAALDNRAETLLRESLEGKQTYRGVPLYEVHRGLQDNMVSMSNRLRMGLGDAVEQGQIVEWTRGRAPINLFSDRRPEELNRAQQGVNRFMGLEWFRHKGRVAQSSEQFIRGSAYIEGLHRYGRQDGGESAGLLAKALHFDYDDLSDWERVWMQGFAVPFWTWTRNNVPLQMRALMKNPGLFNRMRMTNDQARVLFGEDDDHDIVPQWMQERLGWRSRFRSPGGDPLVIGVEGSAVDLNQWIKVGRPGEAGRQMARQWTNALSPVIGAPVEAMFGINTFTGAPHNPRGVEMPGWARALQMDRLPGMGWTDDDGSRRTSQAIVDGAESILPPLGLAERLAVGPAAAAVTDDGTGERSAERWLTSVGANMAALPVSTLTPRQEAGELRGRIARLQDRMRWADVPPEQRARVEALLEAGVPPEAVHEAVFGR